MTRITGLDKKKLKTIPERNLKKDAGPSIKFCFFSRCFSHIFAVANQLAGFSISIYIVQVYVLG